MKKVLVFLTAAVLIISVFTACSAKNESESSTQTTVATIPTKKALIKESDAINFIKNSYTEEELGLADVKEDYSLMISSSGKDIDGEKYVVIAANVMSQSDVTTDDGKPTYSFEMVGEYCISFDGKTVLMKDMKTGEYNELDNRYDEYKSKGETSATSKTEKSTEKSDDQKSTEKK